MNYHEVNLGLLSSGYRNSSDKHDQKTADELDAAAEHIVKLEAQVNRECKWQKQAIGSYAEYDSWATSCGEDYAIMEEWDETPPPYCGHCGGKAVYVTPKDIGVGD